MSATSGASAPSIAPIKTVTKHTKLIIGDQDEYPDESVTINVLVQKATQKASAKSMQKMRKGTWKKNLNDPIQTSSNGKKGKKRRRGSDDEEEDEAEEEDEDRTTYHDPGALVPEKVCLILATFLSVLHPTDQLTLGPFIILVHQQWYYTPDYSKDYSKKPKTDENGELIQDEQEEDENDDEEDEIEKQKRLEESRRLKTDENLSRAYKYGSDLIPISKEEESDFYTFPAGEDGLFVRGFIKKEQVSCLIRSSAG